MVKCPEIHSGHRGLDLLADIAPEYALTLASTSRMMIPQTNLLKTVLGKQVISLNLFPLFNRKQDRNMKKKNSRQSPFSESDYIRHRVRSLPVGKCFMAPGWEETGETVTIVTRCHPKGTITVGLYLVDTFCLGVKDSFYRFSIDDYDLEKLLGDYGRVGMEETEYAVVHNLIYGALEFAEEAGISPCKEFSLTKYILEEDTDAIPLMEFDYGNNGKHFLVADSRSQLDFYLPKLRRNLGDDFSYVCRTDEDDSLDNGGLEDPLIGMSGLTETDILEAMKNFDGKVEREEYTYIPDPDSYPAELDTAYKKLYKLLSATKYESGFPENILKKILGIHHDELRRGLEQILLFRIGRTLSELEAGEDEYSAVATHCIMLLGEVGDKNSLAVLLEVLRQNDDFFDYNFGDTPSEIFIPTLYLLGQDNPDVFNDYLQEPGLFDYARSYVLSAVAMIADRQRSRRDEIVGWFRKMLHFYIENLPEKRCCDGVLVSLLVSDLIDIKAVELLPEIKLLFDTGYVEKSMCGDFETVKKDMSVECGHTEISSYLLDLRERYRHYARWFR